MMGGEEHNGVLRNISGNTALSFLGTKRTEPPKVHLLPSCCSLLNSLEKDLEHQLDIGFAEACLLSNLGDYFCFLHGAVFTSFLG